MRERLEELAENARADGPTTRQNIQSFFNGIFCSLALLNVCTSHVWPTCTEWKEMIGGDPGGADGSRAGGGLGWDLQQNGRIHHRHHQYGKLQSRGMESNGSSCLVDGLPLASMNLVM